MSVELFRYRGVAKDGGRLEYVFRVRRTGLSEDCNKNQVAQIAAEFLATFYGFQVGALRPRSEYRLRIDEIKGPEVVTSYTRWLASVEARGSENQKVYVEFSPDFERILLESKKRLPE